MGHYKEIAIENLQAIAEQRKTEWIEKHFGEVEEGTIEWHTAEEQYYEYMLNWNYSEADDDYDYEEDLYYVKNKTRYEVFIETIENIKILNAIKPVSQNAEDNLKIMLYGHAVAATEGYLSFTFIDKVLSDDKLIKKLVESDPEFANRSVTLKEMYKRQDGLRLEIEQYLKNLIFHKLSKIKPMYRSVLDVDFGDIKFLYAAVERRHDCVHRAGYDKDGGKVDISTDEIDCLLKNCEELVQIIHGAIS